MNDYEVDYELIRETLVQLGERMEALGFPQVLEDVEGSGKLGRCVRDPRDTERVLVIVKYLKKLAQDLLEEERELSQQGKIDPAIAQAKAALEEAYQTMKLGIVDTKGPNSPDQRAAQSQAAQRVQPTMRVSAPQVRRALPSPQALAQAAQLAHAAQLRNPQRLALVPSQVLPPKGR